MIQSPMPSLRAAAILALPFWISLQGKKQLSVFSLRRASQLPSKDSGAANCLVG